MGTLKVWLERSGAPAASLRGIAQVPASNEDVEAVVEALSRKDPDAVKAALLEAIKRWDPKAGGR